ncbi:MAG: hypothetical protein LBU91_01965 [Bacteroidales bacterium]|jgi:hypothetical protein|nr:hypothetical protein [Bacteroidales bacterium]
MMRTLSLIFFSLGIFVNSICGQDSSANQLKFQFSVLGGANIPITKLLQGSYIDYLLLYKDHSSYRQILSMSVFFHKHWGLEFIHRPSDTRGLKPNERSGNFRASVQAEYGNKYELISLKTNDIDAEEFLFLSAMPRTYLGVIYRLENNKFYVYPKLSVGITTFYTDTNQIELKEKNSNLRYELLYSSKEKNRHFTLAPSISFGYKLFKNIYISADIMYSYYKANTTIKKEFTNLYTKEKTKEFFDYKGKISTLSLGVGLTFVIN